MQDIDRNITIKGKTWQRLMELKIEHKDRSLNDVICRLLKRSGC